MKRTRIRGVSKLEELKYLDRKERLKKFFACRNKMINKKTGGEF